MFLWMCGLIAKWKARIPEVTTNSYQVSFSKFISVLDRDGTETTHTIYSVGLRGTWYEYFYEGELNQSTVVLFDVIRTPISSTYVKTFSQSTSRPLKNSSMVLGCGSWSERSSESCYDEFTYEIICTGITETRGDKQYTYDIVYE